MMANDSLVTDFLSNIILSVFASSIIQDGLNFWYINNPWSAFLILTFKGSLAGIQAGCSWWMEEVQIFLLFPLYLFPFLFVLYLSLCLPKPGCLCIACSSRLFVKLFHLESPQIYCNASVILLILLSGAGDGKLFIARCSCSLPEKERQNLESRYHGNSKLAVRHRRLLNFAQHLCQAIG